MDRIAQFEELRPSLILFAYRMLGVRSDAEDVVQDACLRWLDAPAEEIRSPKAYLTTMVSRLSLDALKSARRKREVYPGPWLPEPIVEPRGTQNIEMAESLSMAFLRVLELLSPAERIAFLLREVFDASYAELAQTLETTEENCRQLVTRARKHVHENRPRFSVDHRQHTQVLQQFLLACTSGNPAQLTALLRQDAVLYSDGGGKATAARNPIFGADPIARFFAGIEKKGALRDVHAEFVMVNGQPGALLYSGHQLAAVVNLELDEHRKITNIFLIVNPDKLPRDLPA